MQSVVSVNSNKCLDVAGGSTADRANVQQFGCHGGANQLWSFTNLGEFVAESKGSIEEKDLDLVKKDRVGVNYEIPVVWTGNTAKGLKAPKGILGLTHEAAEGFGECGGGHGGCCGLRQSVACYQGVTFGATLPRLCR